MRFSWLYSLVFFPSVAFAQNVDSLKNLLALDNDSLKVVVYEHLDDAYKRHDLDSSLYYLDQAIAIARPLDKTGILLDLMFRKASRLTDLGRMDSASSVFEGANKIAETSNDSLEMARAYFKTGSFFTDRTQFDKARDFLLKSMEIYGRRGKQGKLADATVYLGIAYDQQGLYSRALKYYLEAERIYQHLQDTASMATQLNNMAIIYKRQGDLYKAGEYYEQSLELSAQMHDSASVAIAMVNKGLLEKALRHYDEAGRMFAGALAYFKKTNHRYGVAVTLHNYGELMAEKGRYGDALKYYDSSRVYAKNTGAHVVDAKNYLYTARLYFKRGNLQKSLENCLKSLDIAVKMGLIDEEKDSQALLSKILEKQGDYQGSLSAFKRFMTLQDSLFNESKNTQINKMKMEFDLSQKDNEISVLKQQGALQEAKSKFDQKLNLFLIVGSVAMFSALVLLAIGYLKTRSLNNTLKSQKDRIAEQNEEIRANQEALIRKNEELVRINKEKDEIIAVVAHDLRSPLNQIKGLMHLIQMDGEKQDDGQRQYFDMIMTSIDTLRERINHTLDLEAINAGKIVLSPQKLEAVEIIDHVFANFKEQAQRKNISLINQAGDEKAMVYLDKNYMIQVYENLVGNAIKFSPEGRNVWLSVAQPDGVVRFHVKDEGPGIGEKEQEIMFNKFQKLSARPTGDESSSGLGLAIVKKYVEAMDGKVWCNSVPGHGAEFIVEFPAV